MTQELNQSSSHTQDRRCFVQFLHPGGEQKPDRSGKIAWNHARNGNPHKRKFLQLRGGEWIDEDNKKHHDDLCAWGAWDPESDVVRKFDPPNDDRLAPQRLVAPYWVRKESYAGLHITDPFIFGDHFLYLHCRQRQLKKLKLLAPGSLIVFGSCKQEDGKFKWMLDTVLVVQDSHWHNPRNIRVELKGQVPNTFLEVTGGPLSTDAPGCSPEDGKEGCLAQSSNETKFRLYRGATPDEQVNGMFSFFPAKPAGDNSAFPRPFIDLPQEYFTPGLRQSAKISCNLSQHKLLDLWQSLVQQVRSAGLVLGTHADLPPER